MTNAGSPARPFLGQLPPPGRVMHIGSLGLLLQRAFETVGDACTPIHPAEILRLTQLMAEARGEPNEVDAGNLLRGVQLIPPCPEALALRAVTARRLRAFPASLAAFNIGWDSRELRHVDRAPEPSPRVISPDLTRELAACRSVPELVRAVDQHCAERVGRPSAIEVAYILGQVSRVLDAAARSGLAPAPEESDLENIAALMTLAPGRFDDAAIADACAGLRHLPPSDATNRLCLLIARRIDDCPGALSAPTVAVALGSLQSLKGRCGERGAKALVLALARKLSASTRVRLDGQQIATACGGLSGLTPSEEVHALVQALARMIEASQDVTMTRDDILLACSGLRPLGMVGEELAQALAPLVFAARAEPLDARSYAAAMACLNGLRRSPGAREMARGLKRLAPQGPWAPPAPPGMGYWGDAGGWLPAYPGVTEVQWVPPGTWVAVPMPMPAGPPASAGTPSQDVPEPK